MKELEVVAGIIHHEGKILCTQRNKSRYAYVSMKYEFPGGKIEPGEQPVDALKRELREELAMDVDAIGNNPYMTVHHAYPDFMLHMQVYLCSVRELVYTLHEHIDAKHVPITDLLQLDWAPADYPIVNKLMTEGLTT